MKKYLLLLGVIMLASCNKTASFNVGSENDKLVWGTTENGDKYKCCWVETATSRYNELVHKAPYYIYDFHSDLSLTVQVYLNDVFDRATNYTYRLTENTIDLDQKLYNPNGEQVDAHYKYHIENNVLKLMFYPDDMTGVTEPYSITLCKRDNINNYPLE